MVELIRRVRESNARLVLSGDTRQHGPVEASDALLAIERHAGVPPVELHTIRRQDPALGKDEDERRRIKSYRKAVEAAAAGKLADSFKRLDEMGAVVSCRLDEQADRMFVTDLAAIGVCPPDFSLAEALTASQLYSNSALVKTGRAHQNTCSEGIIWQPADCEKQNDSLC